VKIIQPFQGMITMIDDFIIDETGKNIGCYKIVSVEDNQGNIVNFVVSPNTYFVDHVMMEIGNIVTGFYDATAPVPMIFPPQFRALVMTINSPYQNVEVDYFNSHLVNSDNTLKLNLSPATQLVLENGQDFTHVPTNINLIVIYGATTRSIPAQTTPYRIIVMCPHTN